MALEAQAVSAAENGTKASPVVFTAAKPWLVVEAPKANDAVQFYKAAFGAEELSRVNDPKRKAELELPLIRSAELKIGSSVLVVSDLTDDSSSPVKSAVSGLVFCLETESVEAAVVKAVAAGAVSEDELTDGEGACCGGVVGKVKDPYGNLWLICSPAKKCGDVAA
ncbi:hypothetical protein SASPL_135742 [Salvia splendens]|uniref:VOC domain-containing protein n=1 Tax=Salvia splendens TaxID=180675 RepID=A0A8X8X0Q6_SALSN|nr:uncharacterized protein At5g48480-like [Salvia splendens]KAG6403518.1 hypothetical protein SASPL_135742 [Salvia splendens]